MRSIWSWAAAGLAVAAAGCGDSQPKLAAVSGQVKVDGKPYPNAYVMFQPNPGKENPNPGRGSMAITDQDGKFTLKYEGGFDGAVVGNHTVRISTVQPADDPARFKGVDTTLTGSPDGEPAETGQKGFVHEVIPTDWNTDSKQSFDVPPGGTDKANFDIKGVKPAKKKK